VAGWLKIAARSFAVAVGMCAAQLGTAMALGVLVWSEVPTPDVWRRQLMWLLFIFATGVLGGVAGGRRSVRAVRQAIANRRAEAAAARHAGLVLHQSGLRATRQRALASAKHKTVDAARATAAGFSRVSATIFAALGAASSFLLVWLPARAHFVTDDLRVLAFAAAVGIVVGSIVSLLSLVAAPIAANAGVTLAGVWIFGLASVGAAIATHRPTFPPRLAVLDVPDLIDPSEWWFGPYLIVAVTGVFSAGVALTARWVGAHRLAIALSGLAGPAIVASSYLLVGPTEDLTSAYVAALLAATVGLLTSTAVAAARPRPATTVTPAPAGPPALASAPVRPLALGAGPAAGPVITGYASPALPAQLPPAPQHSGTAPVQYSANAYPTNQYPTNPGWPDPTRDGHPASGQVYVAPPRAAPVLPPPVSAPVLPPRIQPVAPPAHPLAQPTPAPHPAPAPRQAPSAQQAPPPHQAPPPQQAPAPHQAPAHQVPAQQPPAAQPFPPASTYPGHPTHAGHAVAHAAVPVHPAPPAQPAPPPHPQPTPPTPGGQPAAPVSAASTAPFAPPASAAPFAPPASATPAAALPEPFAAPPGHPPAAPPVAKPAEKVPQPSKSSARAIPVPPPPADATPPATSTPAAVTPETLPATATPATITPAQPVTPAPPAKKVKHQGRADRTVRVPEPPVEATPAPVVGDDSGLPRTARPAEVVAVSSSRQAPAAEPERPMTRRERRRAAKLAAEQAEERARLERQLERDAEKMGQGEREHVDWVKELVNVPVDPTLTTRRK